MEMENREKRDGNKGKRKAEVWIWEQVKFETMEKDVGEKDCYYSVEKIKFIWFYWLVLCQPDTSWSHPREGCLN